MDAILLRSVPGLLCRGASRSRFQRGQLATSRSGVSTMDPWIARRNWMQSVVSNTLRYSTGNARLADDCRISWRFSDYLRGQLARVARDFSGGCQLALVWSENGNRDLGGDCDRVAAMAATNSGLVRLSRPTSAEHLR